MSQPTYRFNLEAGPCARRVVTCTLVTADGEHIVGTNWCHNSQLVCPREPGEGYEKCKTICAQVGHAEEVAVIMAGDKARGAHAYIENHTYACRNCQEVLFAAGVTALTIGAPPRAVPAPPPAPPTRFVNDSVKPPEKA